MRKVLFLLLSCALLSVASGMVGVADAVGSIENQLLGRLATEERDRRGREAEAARDAALPPFELYEVLEALMPPADDPLPFLTWEFIDRLEGIYWSRPVEVLVPTMYPEREQRGPGRIKIRTAGKIFSSSTLLGYPREVPWAIYAYAESQRVHSIHLIASCWNQRNGASGADFDMAAALAVNPRRLRGERVASSTGQRGSKTAYILHSPGHRPVVMEHLVTIDKGQHMPTIYIYYDLPPERDAIYRGLKYRRGR